MTDEPATGSGGRRSFSDVASLFQTIVPPAGTPVPQPAAPVQLPPPAILDPNAPAPAPRAAAAPPAVPADPPSPLPTPASAPPPVPEPQAKRPDPAPEGPWAGAWEPKPNWRPRRRDWSMLLLVPLGLVAAAAMVVTDTGELRRWLTEHVWHRVTPPGDVLPGAAPQQATTPAASAASAGARPVPVTPPAPLPAPPPVAPPAPVPQAAPPAPEPAAAPVAPIPPPDQPTSPAASSSPEASAPASPAPTSPVPAAPPSAPVEAPAASGVSYGSISVHYRRSQPNAEVDANKVAGELQKLADHVEVRAVSNGFRLPTIVYFRPEDRQAALALAHTLANAAPSWSVRLAQPRQKSSGLEVWLP